MKPTHVLRIATIMAITAVTASSRAETKRVRVPISSLPRQDDPIKLDPKSAVLPDGAREGSPVPKSWKLAQSDALDDESGHCTDDRRGSVATINSDETNTDEIWESNGKVFFDRARVRIEDGKVHVVSAERIPVVYVSESVWAYRKASTVIIVTARDFGVFSRAIFWGCFVEERMLSLPAGAAVVESSPADVDDVVRQVLGIGERGKNARRAPWKGVAFKMFASVSRASADPEPMLNLVITKP